MHNHSDFGYNSGAISMQCHACGSIDRDCCDGHGRRLSFDEWALAVDRRVCRADGTDRNERTASYTELYQAGASVAAAVEAALAALGME